MKEGRRCDNYDSRRLVAITKVMRLFMAVGHLRCKSMFAGLHGTLDNSNPFAHKRTTNHIVSSDKTGSESISTGEPSGRFPIEKVSERKSSPTASNFSISHECTRHFLAHIKEERVMRLVLTVVTILRATGLGAVMGFQRESPIITPG